MENIICRTFAYIELSILDNNGYLHGVELNNGYIEYREGNPLYIIVERNQTNFQKLLQYVPDFFQLEGGYWVACKIYQEALLGLSGECKDFEVLVEKYTKSSNPNNLRPWYSEGLE